MRREDGFSLVELAVVIIVGGLVLYGAVYGAYNLMERASLATTKQRMEVIYDALAAYAQRNYRLPCPMSAAYNFRPEPFGTEDGSGNVGGNIPNGCQQEEGLIPHRTLGIPAEVIVDGWSRPFTYRVNGAFARDTLAVAMTEEIHINCRTRHWMELDPNDDPNAAPVTWRNKNPYLAYFCCGHEQLVGATPIRVRRTAGAGGQLAYLQSSIGTFDNVPDAMQTTMADGLPATDPATQNSIVPVFYVLSHGSNGAGAYEYDGSGTRNALVMGDDEARNANPNSGEVWDYEVNETTMAQTFDDLVVWGTQDSLLSRGKSRMSCQAPKRFRERP